MTFAVKKGRPKEHLKRRDLPLIDEEPSEADSPDADTADAPPQKRVYLWRIVTSAFVVLCLLFGASASSLSTQADSGSMNNMSDMGAQSGSGAPPPNYVSSVAYNGGSQQRFAAPYQRSAYGVSLRPFPYPFQAMLAIESDADHMTLRKFNIVHEFLNTTSETPLGKGLGLDVSDSFFMYNGDNFPGEIDYQGQTIKDEMTFFKGTSHQLNDGAIILHYIKVGWIDTFHSAGDFSMVDDKHTLFRRALTAYAMAYLERHGVHITIFTDHGNQSNVANFGAYGMNHFEDYQQGDNPRSPYFITDLLCKEGVRFVWPDLYSGRYSYQSMLFPIYLRDGKPIWGFWRFTGMLHRQHFRHAWRYDWTDLWNPSDLAEQLTHAQLENLVATHGYTIIASHLEGNANKMPLSTSAVEALVQLAHMQDHGEILVARTSRLLLYNLVHEYLQYKLSVSKGTTYIDVQYVADPVDGSFVPSWQQLRGITFTVPNSRHAILLLRGQPVPAALRADTLHTVGVAWYKADTRNYAVWSAAQLTVHRATADSLPAWMRNSAWGVGALLAGLLLATAVRAMRHRQS